MNRRLFLKLPALLPLNGFGSAFLSGEHYFQYEGVIGTSLDLTVWTPDSHTAKGACQTALGEIHRLASILDTRNPSSEISLFEGASDRRGLSPDLRAVLSAYDYWEHRTNGIFGIRPGGPHTPRSVDALGKAYILDHAARAIHETWPLVDGLLLNIGGDIVSWGRSAEIAIADPDCWYDNARPITAIGLRNAAIASSGAYARGAHLRDARSGESPHAIAAATVVAPDAVTANALATTLCLAEPEFGLQLVESTDGAEALRIASGKAQRSSGFAFLEVGEQDEPRQRGANTNTAWPEGYQLTIALPLTSGRSKKRPYVAVWVEDASGDLVRMLAFWGNNSKYHADLGTAWALMRKKQIQIRSVARATRGAGRYELVWDGLDNNNKAVPLGTYRIVVETNQEHGSYAKQAGPIEIGEGPANITLPATTNFNAVSVQYGPKTEPTRRS